MLFRSQSHVFPYRSPRPSTPPSQQPVPAYLSCWWTGDSTDFWGHYLEATSLRFSKPLSSHCRRDNSKHTTAPMTQWREQFKRKKKTVDRLFPTLNPVPLARPEPPHPPTPCPLRTLPSTHFPSWPAEQTHSPLANQTPFPLGNATEGTLLQLREVGLELTKEELPAMGSGRVTLHRGLEVVVGASTSANPIEIPDSAPPTPTVVRCFQCRSTNHIRPQCPEYVCPFCRLAAPGHPQRTCHMCSCPTCGELGHVGTSCPTATAAHAPSP